MATAPVLAACAPAPLRIGIHDWPGYEPLTLAEQFGWLPPTVQLQRGDSASDTLAGLRDGRLHGGTLTLDEVLLLRSEGLPLVVLAVLDESVGADQVLARAARATPADWRGARVAFEPTAVGHLVATLWLQSLGLTLADVQVVPLGPAEQWVAWQEQAIDVAVTYPPNAEALRERGAVVVYDSSQFPGLVLDVLAVHRSRLGWFDTEAVSGLVQAHFRGLEHLRTSPEDALRRIARQQRISYPQAQASFGGLNLPQLTTNRAMLQPGGGLEVAAGRLSAVMVAAHMLPAAADLAGLDEDRFLPPG